MASPANGGCTIVKHSSGKIFEAEIRASLHAFGAAHKRFYWWRFADARDLAFARVQTRHFWALHPTERQPADFGAVYQGRPYFLEAKSSQANRYAKAWVEPHQLDASLQSGKAGIGYYFLFGYRATLRQRRHPHATPVWAANRVLAMETGAVHALWKRTTEKSIPWAAFIDVPHIELPRTATGWDFAPLFG